MNIAMIDISQSASYIGDCRDLLAQLPERCIQTCVTSPPYWGLRDYGVEGQLGLEQSPHEYVANMVEVFRGVRRALRDDGTLWLNLGDSYAHAGSGPQGDSPVASPKNRIERDNDKRISKLFGLKPKDLVGIPWMVAFALREDGWYLRSDCIWHKPNPMPESVKDRPTKAHEYVFLLSKSERYFYDADAVREPLCAESLRMIELARTGQRASGYGKASNNKDRNDRLGNLAVGGKGTSASRGAAMNPAGRNMRTVWTIATRPYAGSHFATMPPALAETCILAGSKPGDIVLDPFFGSGTTGMVAEKHGRKWIGFDLNPEYKKLQDERTAQRSLVLP